MMRTLDHRLEPRRARRGVTTEIHEGPGDASPPIRRPAGPTSDGAQWSLASLAVRVPGEPIPAAEREALEASFGINLGGIRLHESAWPEALGTDAVSAGGNVHFAPGARGEDIEEGGGVLAHEVAHAIQQGSTSATDAMTPLLVDVDPELERTADDAAARATAGKPATVAVGHEGPSVQLHGGESDYLRDIVHGGGAGHPASLAPLYAIDGPNDAVMAPKSNPVSDLVNRGVTGAMDWMGFDTRQRPATEDNDFYRDYAQYMPGYDIDGIPSGAWAQNAATNHVGHGTGPGNPWDNIRRSLVDQEKSAIDADLASGGSGQLSYWDLYDAHVKAYDTSGGGGNRFIDPGSFALAVYGAPLLEAAGIDSGPITGASIDIFNNPEDSRTEGWAKRMGLAGAEIGGGGALAASGVGQMMTGSPLTGAASVAGGAAMAGLGAFGGVWNTATAIEGGMLSDWSESIFGP